MINYKNADDNAEFTDEQFFMVYRVLLVHDSLITIIIIKSYNYDSSMY